jgi:hypothetical protein
MDAIDPQSHRRGRAALEEQIKQGRPTIEKSKERLKRLDEIIDRTASKAAELMNAFAAVRPRTRV